MVNPIDYGLLDAKNGVERYNILFRCHQEALRTGGISYKGITELNLEIPENARPIPLPLYTDFAGVVITVLNNSKPLVLFEMKQELEKLGLIDCNDINGGCFNKYKELAQGSYLLIIEDKEPWIKERVGFGYGVNRKDVMLVKNGKSKQRPICCYNETTSKPEASFCTANSKKVIIKDLVFKRSGMSTEKTFFLNIENLININIRNISLFTPENADLYQDAAIQIKNCVHVKLDNVSIYGTYSQKDKYGYGVKLNNLSDISIKNMYAQANWGVFGNNYLNQVKLKNCKLNRFDIHCYGKDISISDCVFEGLYNQFSSLFGFIEFSKCMFNNFVPVYIESSYNAYSPFDLIFNECNMYFDSVHNYVISLSDVPEQKNIRPELNEKCLPNIKLKNCKVHLKEEQNKWYLIHVENMSNTFDNVSNISLNRVKVIGGVDTRFEICTRKINTVKPINIDCQLIK